MAKIVLIDDEPRLLATLARFLELEGHEVVRGSSFREVEGHLWPGRFEVLVTDIVMPEVDGMQVLREVVSTRECQEAVILITGEPNLESASAAVRLGAFDYIQKPVTKAKIIEAVTRGLRQVKLLRERDAARQMEIQLLKNLAQLGESASVLSHEIKTPVTSLRHALRAVGDKLGVEDKVLIEEFTRNLGRIERLLGETLSFAKPLAPKIAEVSLAELVREAVAECRVLDSFRNMSVDVRIDESIRLRVDPQMFGEIFSNLLRNSAEACGGTGSVEVECQPRDGGLRVLLWDDGPGVPADKHDEIFKPFSSSKDYGTGIGLAFSRKVVESHGGTIGLDERQGAGACFRIELPASAVAGAPMPQRQDHGD